MKPLKPQCRLDDKRVRFLLIFYFRTFRHGLCLKVTYLYPLLFRYDKYFRKRVGKCPNTLCLGITRDL